METLSAQIASLAGTVTQSEIDQWCVDGVRELTNVFPPHLKEYCYSKQTFTSAAANSEAETMITGELGSVYAGSVECRQIRPMDKHKASSSTSIEYATATDPVYYVEGNKLNILPASLSGVYYVIADPSIDASAVSAISNFPNEAEYLVVLYAAIKVLQNKMNEMNTNSAIDTTSLGAITTELDKVDNIIVEASSKIDDYYTSIGDIDDTTEIWDNTNKRFKSVRDALELARDAIDTGFTTDEDSGSGDDATPKSVGYWLADEDTEMVQATLAASQTELQRAQTAIAEINSIMASYRIELEGVPLYLQEASSYIAQAQGYIAETNTRMQRDSQKYQWYQAQQTKLQQDYDKGVQMLITQGVPQQAQQGAK